MPHACIFFYIQARSGSFCRPAVALLRGLDPLRSPPAHRLGDLCIILPMPLRVAMAGNASFEWSLQNANRDHVALARGRRIKLHG